MPIKSPLRPKHVPLRTCVGCGSVSGKRTLIRVVRTPEGLVMPDATGKQAGRGAYICADPQCWEQAVKGGRLERSLKVKFSASDIDDLRAFASDLTPRSGEAT